MKILNLYGNIGGNRKHWGEEHDITTVEIDPKIAEVYQKLWPNDTVVVGDAHQFLLDHFHEYDFIWSSPPCPTHSRINRANALSPYKDNSKQLENGGGIPIRYPDMKLYQEIILLTTWFQGKWCIENVISYYEPLIPPVQFGSHYFWTNFWFPTKGMETMYRGVGGKNHIKIEDYATLKGFKLEDLKGIDVRLALRDVTEPELGKHILDWALKEEHTSLFV
jgi:DNA (cytosine-5)-methyltransferase 1